MAVMVLVSVAEMEARGEGGGAVAPAQAGAATAGVLKPVMAMECATVATNVTAVANV